ncbi:hypothetical protein ABDK56_03820 [Sphingomonas sp. ASV193]|uniref:hypothetical protein n=1 Tax=Sphingomonas sp. ASV193 TaxID=3144405 RepID=UPI0032E92191
MADILTTRERDEARYMLLDGVAYSAEANGTVASLARGLAHLKVSRAPGKPFEKALGAILCDFLQAEAMAPGRWSYRSLMANTFSGHDVGYRTFKRAVDGMKAHRMIEVALGHQQWGQAFGEGPRVPMWRRATRFRPTAWLKRYLGEAGITPDNWEDHFQIVVPEGFSVARPLVLRRKTMRVKSERFRGFGMALDPNDPKTKAQFDRVDRLNHWFASVGTSPVSFRGFQRTFNNGDQPGFDWNMGGRLYAVGGSYQTMKRALRPTLTIDGEETAEIDVKASHPTILAALRGTPLGDAVDPYLVDGIPRDVAKACWTMTLGHQGLHRAWPNKVLEKLEPVYGKPLRHKFPVKVVQAKVVEAFPFLEGWGEDELSSLHLQFVESEAILLTVERLAYNLGVVGLPLHDSIIVKAKDAKVAEEVLREAYREVVGVVPTLERK